MANLEPKLRPTTLLAVALGGMLGAAARVFLPWPTLPIQPVAELDPVSTAIVNVLGAALLGLVAGYTAHRPWPEPLQKGVTTGFLGSFTTMSALAVVVVGFTLGQGMVHSATLGFTVVSLIITVFLIVVFLWLTTVITIGAKHLGSRLAVSRS
ncbi:hypothetical protein GCM10023190_07610 [Enteractinococcus fodinae]|uniref:Fluoride-specific ion channel n=1 Tax=Enteractinococcus fodinae TaxID=684663 RepID=A0ABU2AZJ6_9MICC|nr:CrcB family protein [Enteractinococcus fodinae]MDR7346762.1 CrcB protein [Enteractinococcus fodinae]